MTSLEAIKSDLTEALKAKDSGVRDALRLLLSQLKNFAIEQKKTIEDITDDEVVVVLKREIKKRKEAIEMFEKAGRKEQAQTEANELVVFEKYMPEQLSEDDIAAIVDSVIADMGNVTPQQFGAVMGAVMKQVAGKADGSIVQRLVKQKLG